MEEGVPCPTPAPKLAPPIKKSQDIQDERSKLVNEYACRVLELLGMGHRLFVPRLLAVRSLFSWNGCIANVPSFSLHLSPSVHCMIVWGVPYFTQYTEEVMIPDCFPSGHWARGLDSIPFCVLYCHSSVGQWCHSWIWFQKDFLSLLAFPVWKSRIVINMIDDTTEC